MRKRCGAFALSAWGLYWPAAVLTLFVAMPHTLDAVGVWRWNLPDRFAKWLDVSWPWRVKLTVAVFLFVTAYVHHRLRMEHVSMVNRQADRALVDSICHRLGEFGLELSDLAENIVGRLEEFPTLVGEIRLYIRQHLGAAVEADFEAIEATAAAPQGHILPAMWYAHREAIAYRASLSRIRDGLRAGTILPIAAPAHGALDLDHA